MVFSKTFKTVDPGGHTADLLCPRCGANNLHHEDVSIFDRSEDAEQVLVTEANGGTTRMRFESSNGSGNPSARRDGIVIGFHCEQCGDGIILTIAQHKGSTEIGWQFDETAQT